MSHLWTDPQRLCAKDYQYLQTLFSYGLPHPFRSYYSVSSSLPAPKPTLSPFTTWLKIITLLAALATNKESLCGFYKLRT